MGRLSGWSWILVAVLALSGCATGDPRLEGTWRSHKVAMPTIMVPETRTESVRIRKGSRKTKKVQRTVMVPRTKQAPPYINLTVKYQGASLLMEIPGENGEPPLRKKSPYKVAASDAESVTIALPQPGSSAVDTIKIVFDGPNRYWVNPAGGEGWKEYYDRVK